MNISLLEIGAVFAFGLMIGSFLNVCIFRLPLEEQVVKGRSRCRACGREIAAYDNIPLLSYLLLGGQCRHCKAVISRIYPFVELLTGLLFAAVLVRFGWSWMALVYVVLGAALIMISVIDVNEMIIPDQVTLPGIPIGLAASLLLPELHGEFSAWTGVGHGVTGALLGAGFLWGIGVIGKWMFKKDAMGFGDVKLMAMVGAVIGPWKVLLVNLVLAPVLGALVGLVLKMRTGREVIPFGPFLAAGTLIAIFWGDSIIDWYRGLLLFGV